VRRALLFFFFLLLLAGTAQAAPPTKADEELTVTAPRRLWSTEDEVDARHRADYERLKQKFDPDPPGQTEVGRLRGEMARPAGQRDSPLRDYFRTR
jgi:hypothetical protein